MTTLQEQIAAEQAALDRALLKVPHHLRAGLNNYIMHGHPVGSFLTACLCNDFVEAVCRADEESMAGIVHIAKFLYNDCPPGSWRSMQKVEEWKLAGGLIGAMRSGKL